MGPLAQAVVLMGVTGSGKTTIGLRLAARLNWAFYDGDDFHSPANIEKMRRGEPLTDADRAPWLDRLRELLAGHLEKGEAVVLACSALRADYRRRLVPANPALRAEVRFVFLRITPEVARERVASRPRHFMPASLVDSQFETLEEPSDAIDIEETGPINAVVDRVSAALSLH